MPVYFEAAVVIVALIFVGQVMELRARERTGDAIRALLDLTPKTARRINADGSEYDAPLENILEGDRLRIRPGDSVPVDGVIVEGRSSVDESLITGEPIAVEKTGGDPVTGGTINKNGSLVMEAGKVGNDTMLAKIVDMVASAQRSRAPIQGLADRVSAVSCRPWCRRGYGLHRLVDLGPEPGACLRLRLGRFGSDHRLPLRPGARHADVDHDRDRSRRRAEPDLQPLIPVPTAPPAILTARRLRFSF